MIEFVPYEPGHLALVDLQPAQAAWRQWALRPGYAESLVAPGRAWTGLEDGRVLGCAGLAAVPGDPGRAVAWALFGRIPPRLWPAVVAKVRRVFAESGLRRIEATVQDGFGNGCRLAHLLGLEVEGRMRAFAPDGSDQFLYARTTP